MNPVTLSDREIEDLYVILINWDSSQNTAFKILVNPLVMFIWIGGGIVVLGGLVAFWPERSRRVAAERVERGGR